MSESPSVQEYAFEPYTPPPSFTEQALKVWRSIVRSPGRAALATAAAASLVIALIASLPVTTVTHDSVSGLKAHCGLGYYFAGHPNAAVEVACRRADNSRAIVFMLCVVVLLLALAALVWSFVQEARGVEPGVPPRLRRLLRQPLGAALLTLSLILVVILVGALRTVSVQLDDPKGDGYRVAHCGIQYYVVGAGSSDVQRACRDRYAAHGATAFLAVAGLALGAYVLLRVSRTESSSMGSSEETPAPGPPPSDRHAAPEQEDAAPDRAKRPLRRSRESAPTS